MKSQSPKTMVNLWERFGHLYGHKFTSTYGASPLNENGQLTDVVRTWATGLAGVTGEQVADGLRACVASGEAWPPSLPEFTAMCRGKKEDPFKLGFVPEAYRKPILDKSKLLSSDDRDERRERTREGIQAMRQKLLKTTKLAKPNEADHRDYTIMKLLVSLGRDVPISRRLVIARGEV